MSEARPSDMQGMDKDIVEFQEALETTHDLAIAQKENLREVTTSSVKPLRRKLSGLFNKDKQIFGIENNI
ncbi:hypothetical protein X777_07094 [Ooceraea biroi]|uniref:Uncharacterized protein n=1 Tax=Ooceraea biroi TaxID=2015173 RepID=A0A026W9S7_OOCBI|nr:hypothetical protein X777_07094 [Ooceraea biroi]